MCTVDLLEILLVEDDESDARLTLEKLRRARVKNRVSVVRDGVDAIRYLRRQGPYQDVRLPDVVLIDIDLPRMDGVELLATLQLDDELRKIPVRALVTGLMETGLQKRVEGWGVEVLQKPLDLEQLSDVIFRCEQFALGFVRSPPDLELDGVPTVLEEPTRDRLPPPSASPRIAFAQQGLPAR